MKRILICLALACSALGQVRVVPPIPTNLTPVTLYFHGVDGCIVDALGAAVQRVGQSIRVHVAFTDECITSAIDDWDIAVPLGALEPGNYEVFSNLPGTSDFRKVSQFSVLDATTFPITPPGVLMNQCLVNYFDIPEVFEEADLRFGTTRAFLERGRLHFDGCPAPGLYDVEVTTPEGETLVARNGFTVYEGAPGTTHPYVFEDVLVPIYLNRQGAGGDWRTELALRVTDFRLVPIYAPWGSFNAATSRSVIDAAVIGNRENGFFLRVARNGVERFRPEVRVWNAAVAGVVPTRLTLVRERDWLAGVSVIESLPASNGTRVTVRVYSPDEHLKWVKITTVGMQVRSVQPTRASADAPRFASFEFTVPNGAGLPKMTFAPETFGDRYWVMVTLTDNVTGQVVVLTPQPEETRN